MKYLTFFLTNLVSLTISINSGFAQISTDSKLFIELKSLDSTFFEKGFNMCDFKYLEKVTHKNLIFYHDQSGIQDKKEFFENTKKFICSKTAKKPIRKLVKNSLKVFPLYNNGEIYGAIQKGIHDFYIQETGKEDQHTSRARFTHVWLLKNENWVLKDILSYDHGDNINAKSLTNFEKELTQLLIHENVPALGIGIIKNAKLNQIRVFGESNPGASISYNSIFNVASLTKPVTALVVLKLIDAGKLRLDEPLDVYWKDPDLKNDTRLKLLTPRILLSHQSGFPNWRYLTDSKKLAFEFEPRSKYQYSGEGYEYLRKAVEAKLNQSLEELADSLIFKPAKMLDTHFWWDDSLDEDRYVKNYDKNGVAFETVKYFEANAAANLLTTVEDYGNFLTYIMNGAGLSEFLINEMYKNQVQLDENDYFVLGWEKITGFSNDEYLLIHTGRDPGVNTMAVMFPKSKNAYLIFLNGDNAMKIIEELLTKYMYLGNELWNRR